MLEAVTSEVGLLWLTLVAGTYLVRFDLSTFCEVNESMTLSQAGKGTYLKDGASR
jgi:hypothetical protein